MIYYLPPQLPITASHSDTTEDTTWLHWKLIHYTHCLPMTWTNFWFIITTSEAGGKSCLRLKSFSTYQLYGYILQSDLPFFLTFPRTGTWHLCIQIREPAWYSPNFTDSLSLVISPYFASAGRKSRNLESVQRWAMSWWSGRRYYAGRTALLNYGWGFKKTDDYRV